MGISRSVKPMPVAIERGDVPERAQPSRSRAHRFTVKTFNEAPRRYWRLRLRRRSAASTIIGALMGDPPKGRSALDLREAATHG